MRPRSRTNKTIDIRLDEEKFYFPGETIKGVVLVHPKSATKTNHIVVRFSGQVTLAVKDKETIQLFSTSKHLPITTDGSKIAHVLDAKQHSFPFEFVVPNELPSTVEFGKRKARVKYTLTAIHDRPRVPESLCSKVTYSVPILELVDVTKPPFTKPQEKSIDTLLPTAKYNKKCQIIASIPRFGYTRGEIISLKIVINHFEAFAKSGALEVELVRSVEIRTHKNTATTEDVLKVVKQDVKIIGPYNFSQSTTCQLMIPTSTPPTIRFKDKTLHIHYKVRIRIQLATAATAITTFEMPFVVGTWPRADMPIDDDDDEELVKLLGETMLSDDDDDDSYDNGDGIGNGGDEDNDICPRTNLDKRGSSCSSSTTSSSSHQKRFSVSSSTNLAVQQKNALVGRSDSTQSRISHTSVGSVSSWRSSQSLDNNFSRNPPVTMTPIDHHQQMYPGYPRSTTSSDSVYTASNSLNRSSSTPDFSTPTSLYNGQNGRPLKYQHSYPRHNDRQPFYDDAASRGPSSYYPQGTPSYPTSLHQHIPYTNNNSHFNYNGSGQPSYQHHRGASEDYRSTPLTDDVPTRVLQPIPSVSTPANPIVNRFRAPPPSASASSPHNGNIPGSATIGTALSEDSDDSDDEGDLFGIIERQKKQAERKMRQNQRRIYTVTE
ncbi:hypothetical protein [Absidia glauca]|uniref:Arrestin C-terminal-like domain-containing protein n=1 Tax=Absidia glauca TaxID=4829 RepID=A0A168KTA9_ABSGL|nr:hypothetical protein [Absidia glauca]